MTSNPAPSRLLEILGLACILMLGLFFRVRALGYDPFFQDQAATSMGAMEVVKGHWPLTGPMDFSSIKDPPLPSYLYAMPFAISGDPRVARIFTALWNLFSITLAYKIGRRHFGRSAGLLASALYATHPTAVLASRFIWNPNLAAPFVMLYVYTGLMGYYQSRQIARTLHFPALALAILCHPSLVMLAPVSLMFCLWAWWNHAEERRTLFLQSGWSVIIAILLLAPWLAGNLQLAMTTHTAEVPNRFGDWVRLQAPDLILAKTVLAGEGCWRNNCPMLLGDRPPVYLTHLLPTITMLAAAWAMLNGVLNRRLLPPLGIATAFLLPPMMAGATGRVFDHYVWPLIGNAVIIQAAVLTKQVNSAGAPTLYSNKFLTLYQARRLIQYPYALAIALILFGQARFNILYDPREGLPSLNENLSALKYAMKIARDAQAELILQDFQPPNELRCIGCRGWETLPALLGLDHRVLPPDSGVPSPNTGAFLMHSTNWSHKASYLREKEKLNGWFKLSRIPVVSDTLLQVVSAENYRLGNGVVILGLALTNPRPLPRAAEDWRTTLVWRVGKTPLSEYKFFAHLVDSDGRKYAQVDPLSLPAEYWRNGEAVLNELSFDVSESLPEKGPLFIRFGMYDKEGHVSILDRAGIPLRDHASIQIRGDGKPTSIFAKSISLNEIDIPKAHKQGPPLRVTATWHVHEDALHNTLLLWRMTNREGRVAFETLTDIAPVSHVSSLPAPAFVTAEYNLRIPTDLAPNAYLLELQPVAQSGRTLGEPFSTTIQVTRRNRNFDLPPTENSLDAIFAEQIKIIGYDLKHSNQALTLTLHWQAMGQITVDYKYFVHLWGNGEVVAQADGMPDSYRYPTSWWAPHEVFSDTVTVDLDSSVPERITLKIGLYLSNGSRIPVTDRDGNTMPSATLDLGQVDLSRDKLPRSK